MNDLLYLQTNLNLFFQALGNWIKAPMQLFSFLGQEEFFLLVLPILYWCINASLGLRVGVILMISGSINHLFKLAFHLPRPYWINPSVHAWDTETGFGLPSGHSMNAVSVWGISANWFRKKWAWVIAITLIFLIGLSRIVLGMHFLTDVLAGWLLGGFVLWLVLRMEKKVIAWFRSKRLASQILLGLAVSAGFLIIGEGILALLGGWSLPDSWVQNALAAKGAVPDPLNPEGLINTAGVLFGLILGAVLLDKAGGFDAKGRFWQLLLRYVIGVVGVLVIWYGLGKVFPRDQDALSAILRYIRYAMLGVWVAYGAPAVFWALRLARRDFR